MGIMQKIRAVLDERHLKPADLARMTGFAPARFTKWFRGEGVPSVYQALEIARALNVPLMWLADDERKCPPPAGLEDDERTILRMARSLGYDEAIQRLMIARELPKFEPGGGEAPPGPNKKQAGG